MDTPRVQGLFPFHLCYEIHYTIYTCAHDYIQDSIQVVALWAFFNASFCVRAQDASVISTRITIRASQRWGVRIKGFLDRAVSDSLRWRV